MLTSLNSVQLSHGALVKVGGPSAHTPDGPPLYFSLAPRLHPLLTCMVLRADTPTHQLHGGEDLCFTHSCT